MGRPVVCETAITASIVPPATPYHRPPCLGWTPNGCHLLHHLRAQQDTLFTVAQAHLWPVREQQRSPPASLGLRVTQEIVLSSGDHRQTFEAASSNTRPAAVVQPSGSRLQRATRRPPRGSTLNLSTGPERVTLTATPTSATGRGARPIGRVSWSPPTAAWLTIAATSNGGPAVATARGRWAVQRDRGSEGVRQPEAECGRDRPVLPGGRLARRSPSSSPSRTR